MTRILEVLALRVRLSEIAMETPVQFMILAQSVITLVFTLVELNHPHVTVTQFVSSVPAVFVIILLPILQVS